MLNLREFKPNIPDMTAETGIGKRIREVRHKMRLSQEKFATLVESSKSSICGYELEDVPVPSHILANISIKGNVSADWLLKGEEPMYPKNEQEKKHLYDYRVAEQLKVSDIIDNFTLFTLKDAKKQEEEDIRESEPARHKAGSG